MAQSNRLRIRRYYEEAAKRCDYVLNNLSKAGVLSAGRIPEIETTSPAFVEAFTELKRMLLDVRDRF